MKKSPLSQVQDRFKTKEALVEAVRSLATPDLWLERTTGKGPDHVSNRNLLHLHAVLTEIQSRFGSRSKLIDAVLKAEGREKDAGLRTRFERYPTPRLWDHFRSVEVSKA